MRLVVIKKSGVVIPFEHVNRVWIEKTPSYTRLRFSEEGDDERFAEKGEYTHPHLITSTNIASIAVEEN
jgi:hypothetical protein